VTPRPTLTQAITDIKIELKQRLDEFTTEGKLLEAERLQQRTTFDIEMMETTGSCKGIENYSRYLTGRNAGDPPPTLFEYLPENALLVVDESHVTVRSSAACIAATSRANQSCRIRLPAAVLHRQPALKFEEWERFGRSRCSSAPHPGRGNGAHRRRVREQVIRPTG